MDFAQELMWRVSETSDEASTAESTGIYDLWNGIRNFFTGEEASVEMQELREPLREAVQEAPRLLMNPEPDEDVMQFLEDEWAETPPIEEDAEFMSPEWVEDLERREIQLAEEFGDAVRPESHAKGKKC